MLVEGAEVMKKVCRDTTASTCLFHLAPILVTSTALGNLVIGLEDRDSVSRRNGRTDVDVVHGSGRFGLGVELFRQGR